MNFKVGDRVSFLNSTGGGIISKIVDKEIVHVTIEDGFDIPVMARELIKTGTAEISEDIRKAHENMLKSKEPQVSDDIMPLYLSHNNPEQRPDGLYFCFVPQIQENPLSGSLDLYLLNHTQYTSVFTLYLNHSGSYHGTEYGFIDPESRLKIGTIGRSEIEKWANALLQCIFFMDGKSRPLPPYSGMINFRPIRLYKEENFAFESLLRMKAFFVPVGLISEIGSKPLVEEKMSRENLRALEEKLKPVEGTSSGNDSSRKESFLDKHKIEDQVAEVDLHIGELIDTFSNLDNNDMLNIQMEYFHKCMHEAGREKLSKIIFIHGVGNGRLKGEIHKALSILDGVTFHDASYSRYGLGATQVEFYRNK
jgi:hypothetical protein